MGQSPSGKLIVQPIVNKFVDCHSNRELVVIVRTYVCAYVYVCMYTCICIYVYACIYAGIYICM
jgi:hypothetical protein